MQNESSEHPHLDRPHGVGIDRRDFLKLSTMAAGVPIAMGVFKQVLAAATPAVGSNKKPPVVKVCYLRCQQAIGYGWPGHGFNNDLACREYTEKLQKMGKELGVQLQFEPSDVEITDDAGADRFIEAAKAQKPDALLVCPIGIDYWARAQRIITSIGIPTLIYTPIGGSFTMHTTPLASKQSIYLVAAEDIDIKDMRDGLEMVKTAKNLSQSTLLVVKNSQRQELFFSSTGTKLKYVPHQAYISAYRKVRITEDVRNLAEESIKQAKEIREVTKDHIINAARHYFAAKQLMAQEGADGITSQCLHIMMQVGTPCLAFSALMDEGIVAACEADIGSAMTMLLVHNLLGRPGFMADPLVDTENNLFANAHCTCATRLDGFGSPREPYIVRPHHFGKPHVAMQVLWRIGQVFTLTRFQRSNLLLVNRAKVVKNYESPPSAACITNVGSIVEGAEDNPHKVGGFHVLQVYGDHVRKLRAYGQLYGIEPVDAWDPRVSFGFEPGYPDPTGGGRPS